ncbi:MAG: Spy/CpxP family protein refolding chaperone [Pseudomonadota bacterium]
MNRTLLATSVTAALTIASSFALAQSADISAEPAIVIAQASQPRAPDASGTPRQTPDRRDARKPSERVEARLAYARTALKITAAQQPQWESFATVLRKHAAAMDKRFEQRRTQAGANVGARPDARQMSAIERMERRQQRMAERAAQLTEVIAAAKPLYAGFTPEQKQIADTMLATRGHGGRRDGQHGRGHHGART